MKLAKHLKSWKMGPKGSKGADLPPLTVNDEMGELPKVSGSRRKPGSNSVSGSPRRPGISKDGVGGRSMESPGSNARESNQSRDGGPGGRDNSVSRETSALSEASSTVVKNTGTPRERRQPQPEKFSDAFAIEVHDFEEEDSDDYGEPVGVNRLEKSQKTKKRSGSRRRHRFKESASEEVKESKETSESKEAREWKRENSDVGKRMSKSNSRTRKKSTKKGTGSHRSISDSHSHNADSFPRNTGTLGPHVDMSSLSLEAADYMIDVDQEETSFGLIPNSDGDSSFGKDCVGKCPMLKGGVKETMELPKEDEEPAKEEPKPKPKRKPRALGLTIPVADDDKVEVSAIAPLDNVRPSKRPPGLPQLAPTVDNDFVFNSEMFGEASFHDGGFKITKCGIVQAPGVRRVNSQGECLDGVPATTTQIIYVQNFRDIEYGEVIGAGASGQVQLAVHVPTHSKLAVKIVNVYDEELRKQLLKELATLTTYISRFLVRFYGAFYDAGTVHVVLEFMDSGSLEDAIKLGGKVSEGVTRQIAKHCLHGLSFLHSHNVLHRDFKSANILLSRRLNRSKLSDFGLAKKLGEDKSRAATFVGTLAYMSPERLKGSEYTSAGDIWGLGVSVCECLLGRFPFDRPESYFDYLDEAMKGGMLNENATVSPEARDFVALCARIESEKRPSADELLQHPFVDQRVDVTEFASWLDEIKTLRREKRAKSRR